MAYHPENQGELAVMPRAQRHQMILGVVFGALIAGLFTFSIFGAMIRSLDYPNPWLLVAISTGVGLLAGAAFGPIVVMIFRKRTIQRLGL